MPTPPDQRCELCRFWSVHDDPRHGECKRYPPNLQTQRPHCHRSGCSQPLSEAWDWCGEYKIIPPVPPP
jgi:hypothetical protein